MKNLELTMLLVARSSVALAASASEIEAMFYGANTSEPWGSIIPAGTANSCARPFAAVDFLLCPVSTNAISATAKQSDQFGYCNSKLAMTVATFSGAGARDVAMAVHGAIAAVIGKPTASEAGSVWSHGPADASLIERPGFWVLTVKSRAHAAACAL